MVTIKDVTPERVQKYLGDGYISPEAKDSIFVLIISCILLTFMKGGMWICVPFVILGYVKWYLPFKHGQYITAKLARKRSDHLMYYDQELDHDLRQKGLRKAYTHFKGYWAWELEIMGFTKEEAKELERQYFEKFEDERHIHMAMINYEQHLKQKNS